MLPWFLAAALLIACLYLIWARAQMQAGIQRLTKGLRDNRPGQGLRESAHRTSAQLGQLSNEVARIRDQTGDLKIEARSAGRLFHTVVQELVDGLILVDPSLAVTFYNRRVEDFFPRNLFTTGGSLIEVSGNRELVDIVREAVEEDRPLGKKITIDAAALPGGEKMGNRHYQVETAPLGKTVGGGAWILLRDITERVQTEQVRKDFVTNASHELRTPLTLINGYLENLQNGGMEDPEFAARSLQIMGKHGERLAQIIEDMLTLSKLEEGPALTLAPFDLGECTAGLIENFRHPIEAARATVLAQPEPGACPMVGDRFFWDQILINLITNALKENPDGVGIGISWKAVKAAWIISVWDDGVGIPSAHLPFIFKRFYRVDSSHAKTAIKGTGLGLSIVKRAVEAHGGEIRVQSTPGERTEFIIVIPR